MAPGNTKAFTFCDALCFSVFVAKTQLMIYLDTFDTSCYGRLISWVDSAEMLMQFAGPAFTFPLTKEQLDQSLSDKNRHAYVVIDAATGNAIGHAEIYTGESCAFFGRILIADVNARGKGTGTEIVKRLLDIAFGELGQQMVMLNVFDWNTGAIKCYEKTGFTIDAGKTAERHVNGKTWKVLRMKTDKRDWERLKGK